MADPATEAETPADDPSLTVGNDASREIGVGDTDDAEMEVDDDDFDNPADLARDRPVAGEALGVEGAGDDAEEGSRGSTDLDSGRTSLSSESLESGARR